MPKMTQNLHDCHVSSGTDAQANTRPQLSVGLVLLDQFTLAAFSGFVDVLRLSADIGGASRQIHTAWRVMSVDGLPRTSSAGITLEVAGALEQDLDQFDYIAICGGNDYPNICRGICGTGCSAQQTAAPDYWASAPAPSHSPRQAW